LNSFSRGNASPQGHCGAPPWKREFTAFDKGFPDAGTYSQMDVHGDALLKFSLDAQIDSAKKQRLAKRLSKMEGMKDI
jgi:hypothetical protein